ncbi:hypothetical protein HA466_0065840 [Hirschfeldia incana]|nr:hypothetical protein HA466_0065840 [Hirschfeldia incana]
MTHVFRPVASLLLTNAPPSTTEYLHPNTYIVDRTHEADASSYERPYRSSRLRSVTEVTHPWYIV